jgi:hypothetical protein
MELRKKILISVLHFNILNTSIFKHNQALSILILALKSVPLRVTGRLQLDTWKANRSWKKHAVNCSCQVDHQKLDELKSHEHGQLHAECFLKEITAKKTELLQQNRSHIRHLSGLLTAHYHWKNTYSYSTCKEYHNKDEMASHVII